MLRKILLFASACLLFVGAASLAQVGHIAAQRRELTPLQYNFGPWKILAPFTGLTYGAKTTYPTDEAVQPAALVSTTNNFASTATWTTAITTGSPTFTVSSNVGSVTTGSTSDTLASLDSSGGAITIPVQFVEATVNSIGGGLIGIGIFNATSHTGFYGEYNKANGYIGVAYYDGSAYHYSGGYNLGAPVTPFRIGFELVGTTGYVWYKSANGWQQLDSLSSSSYHNFATIGNLSGWYPGWYVYGNAGTYQISSLQAGGAGVALGIRDTHIVTYPDGRPYTSGTKVFLTATTNPGFFSVLSYDTASSTLSEIAIICDDDGTTIYPGDFAGHMVIDPQNNLQRVIFSSWGRASTQLWYAGVPITTANLLSGLHDVGTSAVMTLPGTTTGWDPNLQCSGWNYSTGACSLWLLAFNAADGSIALDSTPNDPNPSGSPTWTQISRSPTNGASREGNVLVRTATGSAGAQRFWLASGTIHATGRSSGVWSTTGSYLGLLNVDLPAASGSENSTWPQLFSFGNTEYWLSFDDQVSNINNGAMGRAVISTAPKYSAQTNWPRLKNTGTAFSGTSVASESTSNSFTLSSGDLIVAVCRGANTSVASVSLTEGGALGNTYSTLGFDSNGSGFDQAFYGYVTNGGSTAFTCTPNVSSTKLGITVKQFSPGFLTTTDSAAAYTNISTNSSYWTSSLFSTTSKGLIVACADGLFGAGVFNPGNIGPYSPAGAGNDVNNGATPCFWTPTDAAQTSITATVASGNVNTGHWAGVILSFK